MAATSSDDLDKLNMEPKEILAIIVEATARCESLIDEVTPFHDDEILSVKFYEQFTIQHAVARAMYTVITETKAKLSTERQKSVVSSKIKSVINKTLTPARFHQNALRRANAESKLDTIVQKLAENLIPDVRKYHHDNPYAGNNEVKEGHQALKLAMLEMWNRTEKPGHAEFHQKFLSKLEKLADKIMQQAQSNHAKKLLVHNVDQKCDAEFQTLLESYDQELIQNAKDLVSDCCLKYLDITQKHFKMVQTEQELELLHQDGLTAVTKKFRNGCPAEEFTEHLETLLIVKIAHLCDNLKTNLQIKREPVSREKLTKIYHEQMQKFIENLGYVHPKELEQMHKAAAQAAMNSIICKTNKLADSGKKSMEQTVFDLYAKFKVENDMKLNLTVGEAPVLGIDLGTSHCKMAVYYNGKVTFIPKSVQNNSNLVSRKTSAEFLSKCREITAKHLDLESSKTTKTVIAVPQQFTDAQQQELTKAAEMSGMQVMQVLSANISITTAYSLGNVDFCYKKVFIFDLNESSLDLSILDVAPTKTEVLGHYENTQLSGAMFIQNLANFRAVQFLAAHGVDLLDESCPKARDALKLLQMHCKNAITQLSCKPETIISVQALYENLGVHVKQSRKQFESVNKFLFQRIISSVDKVLRDSNLAKQDIDEVILVGDSVHIPKMQQMLWDYFEGKELTSIISPEKVVAYGAAVQAALLNEKEIKENFPLEQISSAAPAAADPANLTGSDVNMEHDLELEILCSRLQNLKNLYAESVKGIHAEVFRNCIAYFNELLAATDFDTKEALVSEFDRIRLLSLERLETLPTIAAHGKALMKKKINKQLDALLKGMLKGTVK